MRREYGWHLSSVKKDSLWQMTTLIGCCATKAANRSAAEATGAERGRSTFYNNDVREYLRECFAFYKKSRLRAFQTRFSLCGLHDSLPDKTRGEIMFEAADFLRELCGNREISPAAFPASRFRQSRILPYRHGYVAFMGTTNRICGCSIRSVRQRKIPF